MRRGKIKRKSRTTLAKLKDKVWLLLKQILDIRDGDTCISCGATGLRGHNKHGGHFIPSSSCGGFLRYDLRNVHNQCATCNLFRNGAGAEYTLNLQKKYGNKFVEQIIQDKQRSIKLDANYLDGLHNFYLTLLPKDKKQLEAFTKKYKGFTNEE